jgi:NAD(P)-dependent dehydrogenase (short-subunit alcohol dehydrogenase family)
LGLSQALRAELRPHRIGVTAVCPGVINTKIARSTPRRGWQQSERAYEDAVRLFEGRNYSPERAAEGILAAVARNACVAPVAPEAWAIYYTKRVAPVALEWLDELVGTQAKRRSGAV